MLYTFEKSISPAFAHGTFVIGIAFGLLAGFTEEIGWTGYAFPKMRSQYGAFGGSVLLGLLWALWHLPVIDDLGSATPHVALWVVAAMTVIASRLHPTSRH